jgi:hypothetical protein
MKNKKITFMTIFFALVCFELSAQMEAVAETLPPPDGCYPQFTTAEGCQALAGLVSGQGNTGLGWSALAFVGDANFNTAVGAGALALNSGDSNTAVGAAALLLNTSGTENTATGTDALVHNTMGGGNTAIGFYALFSNTVSVANTAVGAGALQSMTSGTANTAIGNGALDNLTTGSFNIVVGQGGANITTASNVIAIGSDGGNTSNSTWIGNVYSMNTVSGTTLPVIVSDGGQLGTAPSARRFKKEIEPMDQASESILTLKPVTFHYKSDKTNTPQFGLVAEDVAKVNPNLVVREKNGEIYSVRYDAVNAMLLNEFLKEHRKVEEQRAAITELKSVVAQQQKEFQAAISEQRRELEARLKQQDAKIQRVSDEVGLSKPAPQVVASDE